jgi:hypothetical protein
VAVKDKQRQSVEEIKQDLGITNNEEGRREMIRRIRNQGGGRSNVSHIKLFGSDDSVEPVKTGRRMSSFKPEDNAWKDTVSQNQPMSPPHSGRRMGNVRNNKNFGSNNIF